MYKIFLINLFFIISWITPIYPQNIYQFKTEKELLIFTPTILTNVISYSIDKSNKEIQENDLLKLSKYSVNSFDRFATNFYSEDLSKISDYLLLVSAFSPTILLLDKKIRNDWDQIALLYLESAAVFSAFTSISKVTVQRYRPYMYNDKANLSKKLDKDSKRSFFSGHTAAAFAVNFLTAKIYNDYYSNKNNMYIYLLAGTNASLVAALRVFSGYHFPTDVVTGAIIGTLTGFLIPEIHKNNNFSFHSKYINNKQYYEISFIY